MDKGVWGDISVTRLTDTELFNLIGEFVDKVPAKTGAIVTVAEAVLRLAKWRDR